MEYDRYNPFHAPLKERFLLSRPGSLKETWHLVLDIKNSGITYKVGDSIAILASHDNALVDKTLASLCFTGEEPIICKRTKRFFSLRQYLTSWASITKLPVAFKVPEPYELWDYAQECPLAYSAQELADLLPPLLPRFYSIASALEATPDELHLTVVVTEYETRGILRRGVGTHFLCHTCRLGETIPLYLHPSKDFTLPSAEADIIMVGPGTGIAPFRGFMQKRIIENHSGKNWLFFGDQKRATDFLYEDFWQELVDQQRLSLSLAFSRDQEEKIYVQHRMEEQAAELWRWLERGSYFYVCGDASRMAKDVENSLLSIAQREAGLRPDEARHFIKELRKKGRYLRDIY